MIGGRGKMGRWTADFLASQGFRVTVADPAGEIAGYDWIADWAASGLAHDVIVVATPLKVANDVLLALAERRPQGVDHRRFLPHLLERDGNFGGCAFHFIQVLRLAQRHVDALLFDLIRIYRKRLYAKRYRLRPDELGLARIYNTLDRSKEKVLDRQIFTRKTEAALV